MPETVEENNCKGHCQSMLEDIDKIIELRDRIEMKMKELEHNINITEWKYFMQREQIKSNRTNDVHFCEDMETKKQIVSRYLRTLESINSTLNRAHVYAQSLDDGEFDNVIRNL